MSTPFNFDNPIVPGQQQLGYQPPQQTQMAPYMYPAYSTQNIYQQQMMQQYQQPVQLDPKPSLGIGIQVVPDNDIDSKGMLVPVTIEQPEDNNKKKRGRPKRDQGEIIKAEGTVENTSVLYTYDQTTNMLHETVQQLDMVACEVKEELDQIRLSRTMKNKQNSMIGLATALGKILETKVSAISQINSAISKANDLDYKREKDKKMYEGNAAADDKYILDMYNAFVSNPMGNTTPDVLGPNNQAASIMGGIPNIATGIIRSDVNPSNNTGINDIGYLNYRANVTPEQNLMILEQTNPNIEEVVIYDAATGNRYFEVMDVSTGTVIPNVPKTSERFMEDTFLDIKNHIAKNNNLRKTYKIITINDSVTSQY